MHRTTLTCALVSIFTGLVLAQPAQASESASDATKFVPAPAPAGAYTIDKSHSSLIFRVNHLGFSHFTGRFSRFEIQLQLDPAHLSASRVTVRIDPNSIESDNAPAGFLDMLRGPQWLDTAHYPELTYRSTQVEVTGTNTMRIRGELTLHGATHTVILNAKFNGGYAGHPMDPHARAGFSAQGNFKRSEFGIAYGVPAPGSQFGVGDEIELTIETELSGPAYHSATTSPRGSP